jgi:hypothetical protein
MDKSPRRADSRSTSRGLLYNPKINYRVLTNQPLDPILSQLSPLRSFLTIWALFLICLGPPSNLICYNSESKTLLAVRGTARGPPVSV